MILVVVTNRPGTDTAQQFGAVSDMENVQRLHYARKVNRTGTCGHETADNSMSGINGGLHVQEMMLCSFTLRSKTQQHTFDFRISVCVFVKTSQGQRRRPLWSKALSPDCTSRKARKLPVWYCVKSASTAPGEKHICDRFPPCQTDLQSSTSSRVDLSGFTRSTHSTCRPYLCSARTHFPWMHDEGPDIWYWRLLSEDSRAVSV